MNRDHRVIAVVLAAVAGVLLFAAIRHSGRSPTPGAVFDSRELVQHAAMTRALGIENPATLAQSLEAMPLGVLDREQAAHDYRLSIWSIFFRGTVTKLGRMQSDAPVVAFYNPVADVAVLGTCRVAAVRGVAPPCRPVCAVPGEFLSGQTAALQPDWMGAPDPLGRLVNRAWRRMSDFQEQHPADEDEARAWAAEACNPRNQALAETRILKIAATLARLDANGLRHAVAGYVAEAGNTRRRGEIVANDALPVLLKAGQFSLSGAVAVGSDDWLVFVTPKRTGWRFAALVVTGTEYAQIRGAVLLRIPTSKS